MNSVILAIIIMVGLALFRINIVIALVVGALVGGLSGGLGVKGTIDAFNAGLGDGATIALSYAMLGTFAMAISRSGLTSILSFYILKKIHMQENNTSFLYIKYMILSLIILVSISAENIIPVHIAFIPILIPPLLQATNKLKLDRRVIACCLTFGLVAAYMVIPLGFGGIFLNDILHKRLLENGLDISSSLLPLAMSIPVLGMAVGLLIAIFISYRKKRDYEVGCNLDSISQLKDLEASKQEIKPFNIIIAILAVVVALATQLYANSIIIGSLAGFLVFILARKVKLNQTQDYFDEGLKMMALIGFIMIAANGFANVINETKGVTSLVQASVELIGTNKPLASFLMLLIGLLITLGIGSSFSTIPIIATIYAPLCIQLGFSPLATVCIIGTAAALGDAGSPASDSTIGPTSGLNTDGKHDHIWDSVVPTFLHFNIPLIIFGWFASIYIF